MSHTEKNGNGVATAALIFAFIAAVFSALTYFTLPAMVTSGVERVEALKVGGQERYEQLKKIYQENAEVFGEQVDQIEAQLQMYQQMQVDSDAMMMEDGSGEGMSTETMPDGSMMMTGDEAMMAQ